jgi:hypothetical protein
MLKKYAPYFLLVVVLAGSAVLMLSSAKQESAIMDELAHIPAGYGYVKFLDFRLNPEHPPLLKALSAAPLLFMPLQFPTHFASWATDLNGQWDAGRQFLYEVNGSQADAIIFLSRLLPIALTLLLVILIYAWSKKLLGPWWALVPAFLTALSPSVLAHGHYVTTDIAASLGFFLGLYGFWILFKDYSKENPAPFSLKKIIFVGLLFGIAQLLKFSLVLLIPLYIFFMLVLWFRGPRTKQELWRLTKTLLLVLLVGYLLVWLVYIVFTINYPVEKQVSDTSVLLNQLTDSGSFIKSAVANATVWAAGVPVLRGAAHYVLGVLMVSQRAAGGNTAYFLGADGNGGWWYYFPVVFLLKETLPALIMLLAGFFFWLGRLFKRQRVWDIALFMMLSFVIFYWAYSIKSPLNIGFRHILPTVPFLYMLAASSIKKWVERPVAGNELRQAGKRALHHALVGIVLLWAVGEAFVAYPHFISYFNEAGNGKWGGYTHAVDSNYDWGQDLKRLQQYVQSENIPKIAVDYFGGGHVPYYIPNAVLWDESKGNPLSEDVNWLAVSVNELMYDIHAVDPAGPGFGHRRYRWISNPTEPYARIGTSIFVYRLR